MSDSAADELAEIKGRLALAADHLVGEVMHSTARAEAAEQDLAVRQLAKPAMDGGNITERIHRRIARALHRSIEPLLHETEAAGTADVLLTFPYYSGNRWQDIMYSRLRDHGWTVAPLPRLDPTALEAYGAGAVLHVNWTGPITQATPDLVASACAARAAIGAILEFQKRGGKVIWTIHNVLPHELHHLGPELAVCRSLAAHADLITVMNPATPSLVSGWYQLSESRTIRIPHPSYLGEFADTIDRATARARFGLEHDEVAVLFLGQLRPYKGLDFLLAAFERLRRENPRVRLLVAGEPGPGFTDATRDALIDGSPGVISQIGRVADDEMQVWCRAADLMVLPYQQSLNISLVEVAATFGLPVALRESPSQRFLGERSWVRALPSDEAGFATGLELIAQEWRDDVEVRASALADAVSVSPGTVAEQFRKVVVDLVRS